MGVASILNPMISIIIPVLNEASTIASVLTHLPQSPDLEVWVVDGGSRDQTLAVAQSCGAKVIASAPGRSRQMNVGAEAAIGEILLFLHADTQLPTGFVAEVQNILATPGTIAGAFRLQIDGTEAALRWVERGVNWRSRHLQLPYGDQAIFLRAKTFHDLGGFSDLPIMEDFELVRRLQKRGKVAIASTAVLTSARRWQKLGVCQTTLMNQVVIVGYLLGISPVRLASWYRGRGRNSQKNRD
jgi:rSAM/selenodomain-associated transferase 2